ncbi:MAG: hypothetical protein ACJ8J0_03375 [Longimicrobiaceae bacterium]
MRKLQLDIDTLEVSTFEPVESSIAPYQSNPLMDMQPNKSDWGASCSGCTFVDLPCCTNRYCYP